MKYYIGWDVGAWKCTNSNNSSCDALFVLDETGEQKHYRDNISETIQMVCDAKDEEKNKCLIDKWFELCRLKARYSDGDQYYIAIDTPLGWSKSFGMLLNGKLDPRWTYDSEQPNIQNLLLFRRTERELGSSFSSIVDAIGSQSTKGIALLCALKSEAESWGVWVKRNIKLFETYPKACIRSLEFLRWMHDLRLRHDIREYYYPNNKDTGKKVRTLAKQDDIFDAAVCACLAKAFVEGALQLKRPPVSDDFAEQTEGWIFYPDGKLLGTRLLSKYVDVVNANDVATLSIGVTRLLERVTQSGQKTHLDEDSET